MVKGMGIFRKVVTDLFQSATSAPTSAPTATTEDERVRGIYFVSTKNGKKLHRCWGSLPDRTYAYTFCGRTFYEYVIVAGFPDGGGYWETKYGQGLEWARSKVGDADLCQSCWYSSC